MPTISPRAAGAARVRQEGPIDLETAASLFPRGNRWKEVTVRMLLRMIVSGRYGVRLDAAEIKVKVDGKMKRRWHTSIAAMNRFVAETAGEF